jgi:hypothetical protein
VFLYYDTYRIAPDFCSDSRRFGWRIRYVFACRSNAESGRKDKQDGGLFSFHWLKTPTTILQCRLILSSNLKKFQHIQMVVFLTGAARFI